MSMLCTRETKQKHKTKRLNLKGIKANLSLKPVFKILSIPDHKNNYNLRILLSKVRSKDWLFISRNCKLDRNRWVPLILLRFARPRCSAATHLSSPEVGNWLN